MTEYLYHGTSKYQFEKMRDAGFRVSGLYLAVDENYAGPYMDMAAERDGSSGVMIKIDLSKLDPDGLQPDWDEIEAMIDSGDWEELAISAGYKRLADIEDPDDVSWRESLDINGSCSYDGDMGRAIVEVEGI